MSEPIRQTSLATLEPYVADRVQRVLEAMKSRKFDPVVFEAKRTAERQSYLYSIGRTRELHRKPVTWTLKSKHLSGKAVDIISKTRGWNWPAFYDALQEEAAKEGLETIPVERCHIQWEG